MVELIVTVVLAGIIFAAMVPLFVNASKASGRDRVRNVAASAAQGRIDSIRLLSWSQLTDPSINTNLQSSTFAGGLFGSTYTPPGSNSVYAVQYSVTPVPSSGQANYVQVRVSVTTPSSSSPTYTTTMATIVLNPAATSNSSSPSPSPTPTVTPTPTPTPSPTTGFYTLTILVTTSNVNAGGVTVVRTDVTPNTPASPALQIPTATTSVGWVSLPGGPGITYLVTCNYKNNKVITQTITLTGDTSYTFNTQS